MDKEKALKILLDFKEILGGRRWWLEAGTCLGATREKDFIEWDHDLDVGIMAEDFGFDLIESIVHKGFSVRHIFGMFTKGFEIAFIRDGIKIDLFLFYKKDDKRWHGAWRNGSRNGFDDLIKLVFEADMMENRKMIEFKGYEFPVPSRTEEYLTARYGQWKEPNKRWDWSKDPRCIQPDFEI